MLNKFATQDRSVTIAFKAVSVMMQVYKTLGNSPMDVSIRNATKDPFERMQLMTCFSGLYVKLSVRIASKYATVWIRLYGVH